MAWIELHQTRQRHPKTLALAGALKISRREACGLLDDLWTWALDIAAPDGTLPGLTCDDVAVALDYPRKRGKWLMDALIRSGYVDQLQSGAYMLHDWADYAGRLNEKRMGTKERVERYRERKKTEAVTQCNALQSVTNRYCNASTVPIPYPTVPSNYDDDDARAREGVTPGAGLTDPFDPACTNEVDAAVQRLLIEFVPCGLAMGNAYTQDEIVTYLTLPQYGATLEAREGLVLRAMKAAGEGKAQYRTWGGVKSLIAHWQKNGEGKPTPRASPPGRHNEPVPEYKPIVGNPFRKGG